jgi:hypothetical protein
MELSFVRTSDVSIHDARMTRSQTGFQLSAKSRGEESRGRIVKNTHAEHSRGRAKRRVKGEKHNLFSKQTWNVAMYITPPTSCVNLKNQVEECLHKFTATKGKTIQCLYTSRELLLPFHRRWWMSNTKPFPKRARKLFNLFRYCLLLSDNREIASVVQCIWQLIHITHDGSFFFTATISWERTLFLCLIIIIMHIHEFDAMHILFTFHVPLAPFAVSNNKRFRLLSLFLYCF